MSVLRQGDNSPAVAQLQADLNRTLGLSLKTDGDFGPVTVEAVKQFQRKFGIVADGVAGPVTQNALAGGAGYKNANVVAVVGGKKLTEQDYVNAAAKLGVSVAHVKTVTEVEARGTGYLSDGRVKILYERHVFYKQVPKAKRASAPADLCQPTQGGYVGNAGEWDRMARACAIDETAALESASWGLFQIMGYHWRALGFASVQDFVEANKRSEGEQLDAFVRFVLADKRLINALRAKDWKTFARYYNGPAYAKNAYDIKLAQAFTKWSKAA